MNQLRALAVLWLITAPYELAAQSASEGLVPFGAAPGTPAAAADSLAAAGDTTAALALLANALKKNRGDAVAWYYNGMYLWAKTGYALRPDVFPSQRLVRTVSAADSSLRLATRLAPDSARYLVSLGRFTLQSSYSIPRAAARLQSGEAVRASKRTGDLATLAVASDMAGMFSWRDYEYLGNRGLAGDSRQIQLTGTFMRKDAADVVKSFLTRIEPPTGQPSYDHALEHFRTAVGADSSNLRYSRHLYMALAAQNRWEELLDIATRRSGQFPLDYQARLARGLALHRRQQFAPASAAFDTALALMDEGEAERLTRFTRLLRPKTLDARSPAIDTARFNALPPEQRRGLEAMHWLMNDPLTLTAENELRLEFLARVTYADFRWTDELMALYGADTDRGDIYVRYGPPLVEITAGGGNGLTPTVTLIWEYPTGIFFFDLSPTFNTARFAWNDRDYVNRYRDVVPSSFANIAANVADTIPVRVVRFRAGGDSVDAVVAARIPLASLTGGAQLDRVPVVFDFRIFDQFVRVQGRESGPRSFAPESLSTGEERHWTRRLGPGINVIRVEALQADTRRAARATARLDPVPVTGFAMSDVLLGTRPVLAAGKTVAARWRDVVITPREGVVERGAPLGLVWELYELSAQDGAGRYRVAITIARRDRGGPRGLVVRALDGVGLAMGRTRSSRDTFTISFDRTTAIAPTLVEFLSLDLSDATAGRYTLRVEISDLGSGQKASRSTEFSIR